MKIKSTAKELKNADVRFISLVKRGANRLPFRILKTDKGENQMIDLASLSPVLKGEKIEAAAKKAYWPNFGQILAGSVSRDIGTPPPTREDCPRSTRATNCRDETRDTPERGQTHSASLQPPQGTATR